MTPAVCSWKEFWPAATRAWNVFFHEAADPRLIGLVRIAYAAILLTNILCWWPDLERWFGPSGVLPWSIADELRDPRSLTIFAWLPHDSTVLWTCYFIFITQTVLLLLGVFPRLQVWCTFAWLVSFQHRQMMLWDSEDAVMRLIGFFLLFAPLQQSAILAWRRPFFDFATKPNESSAWAIRLIQIQMCVIFLCAAYQKLLGDAWLDGTAVYFAARLDEFAVTGAPTDFLFDTPWIVRLLTWGTIAIEGLVPILVWFKETRRPALIAVLAFHLGCMTTMHLFLFHPIMLCGWCAFLSSDDLDFIWRRAAKRETIPSPQP